jgi:nucleolar GTP-binding protein
MLFTKQVLDFVDPDIDAKLAALEREEDALAAEFEAAKGDAMEEEHLTAEEAATLEAIRDRKKKLVAAHRRKKKEGTNSAPMPRKVDADRSRTAGEFLVRLLFLRLVRMVESGYLSTSDINV